MPILLKIDVNNNKLKNLTLVPLVRSHNPDKVIINYSSYQLSDIQKTVLNKGLNFGLQLKKFKLRGLSSSIQNSLQRYKETFC